MAENYSILLLEDEPLILMDLEMAAEDRGCAVLSAASCKGALEIIESGAVISVAILDVSLGQGETCFPVASELARRHIPFILHSGDLDRHDEMIREIGAELIAKPAPADKVVAAAFVHLQGEDPLSQRIAAQ